MTETNETKTGHSTRAPSRHGFAFGLVLGGILGGLVIGALGSALAAGFAGHGPWGRHHRFLEDPAVRQERIDFATEWILGKVEATDAQTEQVKAVLTAAVNDIVPLAEQHRQNRQALAAELSGPEIDREAIERIRQAEMQLMDEGSRKLADAIATAAETLTAEQRQELAELARRFHER